MAQADLIIKAKDLEDIERDLTQVSQSFAAYAKTTDSLEDAVGEPKLGGKLAWFAERWRIKRGKMSEQFEALRKEVQTQREAWDDTDAALAGEDDPHDNDDHRPDDRPDDDKPTNNKPTDNKLDDDTPLDNNPTPQPPGPGSGDQSNNTSGDRSKNASSTDDLGSETAIESPGDGPSTGGESATGEGGGAGSNGVDGSTDQTTGGDVTAEDLVQGAAVGGVVGSIYSLWQSARERAAGGGSSGAGESESGQSVEQMLRQDLDSAGLGDKVELSTDPGDPDDIIALLRQDDGSSLRLEFEDGDGDPALGAAAGGTLPGEKSGDDWRSLLQEPAAGEAAGGALDAAETPLDTSAGGGGGGGAGGGGGGGSLGGGESLLSGDDLTASDSPTPAAVGLDGGGTASARPADWSETPAATASPSNVSSDSAADSSGIASLGGMAAMRMGGMGGRSGGGSYEERRRKRRPLVETEQLETPEGQEKK